ncbi:MAG: hypothetical protein VXY75_02695, partial [Bacteroidota bacterium]|nr:hypothetical protein [Bacteroidota bacterium]
QHDFHNLIRQYIIYLRHLHKGVLSGCIIFNSFNQSRRFNGKFMFILSIISGEKTYIALVKTNEIGIKKS